MGGNVRTSTSPMLLVPAGSAAPTTVRSKPSRLNESWRASPSSTASVAAVAFPKSVRPLVFAAAPCVATSATSVPSVSFVGHAPAVAAAVPWFASTDCPAAIPTTTSPSVSVFTGNGMS
jgi:hypothetical protein